MIECFRLWTHAKPVKFVRVHQALLNILIGKSGLFSTVPFIGQPIAAILRQIETVVDVSVGSEP